MTGILARLQLESPLIQVPLTRKQALMLELSTETRVTELEQSYPALLETLKSTGMFKDGDNADRSIGELCLDFGLHPQIILNMLQRTLMQEPPPDIDISELEGLSLPEIVSHLETVHHEPLRKMLPVTVELMQQVVAAFSAADERLLELQKLFEKMAHDLEEHMVHEEEALFPMCRDMAQIGEIQATPCGDKVGGPIQCMRNDHDQSRQELTLLSQLTDGFKVPEGADEHYRELIERLRDFVDDLTLHIHKEDHLLFPRALETQAALREGRQAN